MSYDNVEQMEDDLVHDDEGALFLEPRDMFDPCIIGMAEQPGGMRIVAYDEDLCIAALMKHSDMDYDEAVEFFMFNTKGAYMGEGTPIFIERIERA